MNFIKSESVNRKNWPFHRWDQCSFLISIGFGDPFSQDDKDNKKMKFLCMIVYFVKLVLNISIVSHFLYFFNMASNIIYPEIEEHIHLLWMEAK